MLHDIQGLLAARHELLAGRGGVEAERPQNLRHQLDSIQDGAPPTLETLDYVRHLKRRHPAVGAAGHCVNRALPPVDVLGVNCRR
jgi:hypothetical protein